MAEGTSNDRFSSSGVLYCGARDECCAGLFMINLDTSNGYRRIEFCIIRLTKRIRDRPKASDTLDHKRSSARLYIYICGQRLITPKACQSQRAGSSQRKSFNLTSTVSFELTLRRLSDSIDMGR